jgi:glycolate oxidase iron-sulfur subunit
MSASHDHLTELTSQCVRCGLCLPHCPTYQQSKEEPESPRGRIALLAASAHAEVSWQPSVQHHIDQCLACGHCERVCPAKVRYSEILIRGRAQLLKQHALSWKKKCMIRLIETATLRNLCYTIISSVQTLRLWNSCIAITALFSKKLSQAMQLIPTHHEPRVFLPQQHQPITPQKVLLFSGCSGKNFGQATLASAKKLLLEWGYNWLEPMPDLCCGALSAHAGLPQHRAEHTVKILNQLCHEQKIAHIILFATGCSSFSQTWSGLHPSIQVTDIQQFLQDHWPTRALTLNSKPLRVGVHSPCTQTNGLNNARLSYNLLSHLPNAILIPFGENTCCGASGTYMFEHPAQAAQFAEKLLTQQLLDQCDIIVTSNIGCQLHFKNFLRKKKSFLRVCHPIELLLQ